VKDIGTLGRIIGFVVLPCHPTVSLGAWQELLEESRASNGKSQENQTGMTGQTCTRTLNGMIIIYAPVDGYIHATNQTKGVAHKFATRRGLVAGALASSTTSLARTESHALLFTRVTEVTRLVVHKRVTRSVMRQVVRVSVHSLDLLVTERLAICCTRVKKQATVDAVTTV
jgi:hypothetical protein